MDSAISMEADLLPKHRTRRVDGPSRLRADAKDIMELWGELDAAQADLPTFVAVSLERIPPTSFSSSDVGVLLSVNMLDMKAQLKELQAGEQKRLADAVATAMGKLK